MFCDVSSFSSDVCENNPSLVLVFLFVSLPLPTLFRSDVSYLLLWMISFTISVSFCFCRWLRFWYESYSQSIWWLRTFVPRDGMNRLELWCRLWLAFWIFRRSVHLRLVLSWDQGNLACHLILVPTWILDQVLHCWTNWGFRLCLSDCLCRAKVRRLHIQSILQFLSIVGYRRFLCFQWITNRFRT